MERDFNALMFTVLTTLRRWARSTARVRW